MDKFLEILKKTIKCLIINLKTTIEGLTIKLKKIIEDLTIKLKKISEEIDNDPTVIFLIKMFGPFVPSYGSTILMIIIWWITK